MAPSLNVAAAPRFFSGRSVRSRLLGMGLRGTVRPALWAWSWLPIEFLPPNLVDHLARFLPVPEGTTWRTVELATCHAELLCADDVQELRQGNRRIVLYFHGGAFLTCGLHTHRRLVARISKASGQPVLNVDYRLMPYSPITDSVTDCLNAFTWLLDQGYAPEDITLAGDSAGGYLAFSVARAVLDRGLGRPAGVVALSPLLDMNPATKRAHPNASRCEVFPIAALERFTELAKRVDARRGIADERICPVNMDPTGLPPTLIQVGSGEIVMVDAEAMANRLVAAGVPCELQIWKEQVHVFQAAASWVPEAQAAISEIGAFMDQLADSAGRTSRTKAQDQPATKTREKTRTRRADKAG